MSDRELFMYDVRVRERFLAEGAITKADVERRLAALRDLEDQCEEVDLEQPALSKEPEEVIAPVVSEMQPVDRMPAMVSSDSSMREVATIPAIAESTPATPAPAAAVPVAPASVPAIASESTPAAPEPHGPASVPPPTASVDADWGDS